MSIPTVPRPRGSEAKVAWRPGVEPYVFIVTFPAGAADEWATKKARNIQRCEVSIFAGLPKYTLVYHQNLFNQRLLDQSEGWLTYE